MAPLEPTSSNPQSDHSTSSDSSDGIPPDQRHPPRVPFLTKLGREKARLWGCRSVSETFQRASNAELGYLGRLPTEILIEVIQILDLDSLFNLRQVNLQLRHLVTSLQPYQLMVTHGLEVFNTLLHTGLAVDISLRDFENILCTMECSFCGKFSGYVSLLIWKRCCVDCRRSSPETQVRGLESIIYRFQMTKAEVDQLKSFIPPPLGPEYGRLATPFRLASLYQAEQICKRPPNTSLPALGEVAADPSSTWGVLPQVVQVSPDFNYMTMGSLALPCYDKVTRKVESKVPCMLCFIQFYHRQADEKYRTYVIPEDFYNHPPSCNLAYDLEWQFDQ